MQHTFTNSLSPLAIGGIVGAFLLTAFPAAISFGWRVGVLFAMTGFAVAGALRALRSKVTIQCGVEGATIETYGHCGCERRRFAWGDVLATEYSERTISAGNGTTTTVGRFVLHGHRARLLEVDSHMRDFNAIVALVNDRTRHLPYCWLTPNAVVPGQPTQGRGAYVKALREPRLLTPKTRSVSRTQHSA